MNKNKIKERTPKQIERVIKSSDDSSVLAEKISIDGSHWKLCVCLLDRKSSEWSVLEDLASKSSGVNPFYEPSFLLALRGKMMRAKEFHLILFEGVGEQQVAKLAFPVFEIKTGKGKRYLKAYENAYAPLATPMMVDKDSAETVENFTQLLGEAIKKHKITLRIQTLSKESPFAKIFAEAIKSVDGVSSKISKTLTRAAIYKKKGKKFGLSGLPAKRKRELVRLEKKLAEKGKLEFESVTEKLDILLRFEEFLLLEMKGWKGRKGTSMQLLKKTSAFARMAVTDLADRGKAEIFSMRLDGKSIATIILFKSNGYYYPWKIAFDEDYSLRSPGSVLMYNLTKRIISRPDFIMADSLAKQSPSWVNSIWYDEMDFVDVVVGPNQHDVTDIANSGKFKSMMKRWIKNLLKMK